MGLGSRATLDQGTLYRAAATATRALSTRPREKVVLVADGSWSTRQLEQAVAGSATGTIGQERLSNPFLQ